MEPVYHDGQIVWVQQCETLRTGEVGVMIYDGQGYIKAYAEQEPDDPEAHLGSDGVRRMQPVLVSYNKAYAPKPVSPELEFRIVGRVL
ncbi:MAG: S24 family peptidase [Acutalibacteraceae bacterium]